MTTQFDVKAAKKAGYSDEEISSYLKSKEEPSKQDESGSVEASSPTQRIRSLLQGVSFKTADEAEAFARSKLFGEDFDAALTDVRSKLKNYEKSDPLNAALYETIGVLPIAALGTVFTGGGATPLATARILPTLAKVAGFSAIQGGAAGAGGAEGDSVERGVGAATGAGIGAVAGPAAYLGTKAVSDFIFNPFMDFARRITGGKSKVVETEVQRIAQETGLSNDEIVAKIASGETLSENKALNSTIRAYVSKGGEAANILRNFLSKRPEELRGALTGKMQVDLGGELSRDPNILKAFKASEEARRLDLNKLYEKAYSEGGEVTEKMVGNFSEVLKRSPDAAKRINDLYLAQTGKKPFFKISEDGSVSFERPPTLQDMEIARRGIQADINDKFKSGSGDVAQALKPFVDELKLEINKSSSAIEKARTTASTQKTLTKSFDEGRKVFTKSADQVAIDFEDVMSKGGDAVSAFRAGVMDQIRNKMSLGGKATTVNNIADPNTKEGQILRIIYPQDKVDDIIKLAGLTSQSQRAAGYVLGGSATAPTEMAASRVGSNISAEEISSTLSGNVVTGMRVLNKIITANAANLTPKQKAEIARVLISQDPNVVKNALTDTSAMGLLAKKVQSAGNILSRTTPGLLTGVGVNAASQFLTNN
jgi:hypothetical protein